jgi:hypothetical protein
MSNLSLRLETLPRPVGTNDQGIFNILASLIHPASRLRASEAAHVIVNVGYQSRERPSDFKPLLFEITIHIARQIPHTHPSQQKLVDLLKALSSTPSDDAEEWQWANILADGSGELAETYRCEFYHTCRSNVLETEDLYQSPRSHPRAHLCEAGMLLRQLMRLQGG